MKKLDYGTDIDQYENYNHRSLTEVEQYIKNKHLPDVKPATLLENNSMCIGNMEKNGL